MSIQKQKIYLKPVDFFIIFLFISTFFTFFRIIVTGEKSQLVEITSPDGIYQYELKTNRQLELKGREGITQIFIQDGNVWIADSACKNKTCVHAGKINKNGQWLCCAPNGIFVIIRGQEEKDDDEPDALSF